MLVVSVFKPALPLLALQVLQVGFVVAVGLHVWVMQAVVLCAPQVEKAG